MGKSSLSIRVLAKLESAGVNTALIDLTRIGGRNVTAAQWYAGLCDAMGASLGLRHEMLEYFRLNAMLSPMQRFFGSIEHVAMANLQGPISIFFDEIDSTKNLSFQADEFFAGIRECYNRRVQNQAFFRLTFCLIGVAVPTDLISNPSTTPFNIGERIQLSDFSLSEMQVLAAALGKNGQRLVERIHYWTGGQPFLSQSLCEAVSTDLGVQSPEAVDAVVKARLLERRARTTNINLADVGDRALNSSATEPSPERFRASILAMYERVWRGESVPDDESNRLAVILKLSGLVRSDGLRLLVRNRIYREVFDRKWIEDNMPERELLRERRAFRRGILRAGTASAVVLAVVGGLGILAWRSENDAVSSKRMLDYQLYVSDMNNMRLLEEIGDIARMDEILGATKRSPYRGFEWSFWQGRVHDSKEEYTLDYTAPGKREDGLVSQDGKQICVFDLLTGIAAIVDRKSNKPVVVRRLNRRARIIATSAGFTLVEAQPQSIRASRVEDGRPLSTKSFATPIDGSAVTRPRSNYAFALLRDPDEGKPRDLVLWDLVDGRVHFSKHLEGAFSENPLAFSADGTRVLYGIGKGPGFKQGSQQWIVFDTVRGVELDSFEVPPQTILLDYSDSGELILYRDTQRSVHCRNVASHKLIYDRQWDGGDIPTGSWITADDKSIAQYYGNGKASLLDMASGRNVFLGLDVWSLGPTNRLADLIAASTSVRVIKSQGEGDATVIGQGAKLARDDKGRITVFHEAPLSLSHYSDPGFKLLSETQTAARLRGGYPYNGLWRLVASRDNKTGAFTDADGKEPSLFLSPIPVNYSCGVTRNSLCVLERGGRRIDGIDGQTGKVRWSYNVASDKVTGLWVSPKGDTVFALAGDVDLIALDVGSGRLRSLLKGHNLRISNLSFTRDGGKFFTCGVDGRVILWDLATLNQIMQFRGNAAMKMSAADLSPDGSRVATCNFTGSWQLWDSKTGRQLMDIHGSALPMRSIVFTSDGAGLLTAGDDLKIRRWSALSGDRSVRIPVPQGVLGGISR